MSEKLIPFRSAERKQEPDESLVTACARGDSSALEELFQRHGERVHRVLARMHCIERRDLDDVVQSTFVELGRSAKRFDGRSSVATWIIGIAMNVMRHYVRGEIRRRVAMSALAETPELRVAGRPDEDLDRRRTLARLQRAFEGLPQGLRVVFALCDLEGMRGVEVARALHLPEGTVWRRLHEARTRLRLALEDDEGGSA